jgi:hypothetical protein
MIQKKIPIEDFITFSTMKFMHKFTHGKLPQSFYEIWVTNRTRNPNPVFRNFAMLIICIVCSAPQVCIYQFRRFPFFYFPRIWNEDSCMKFNPSFKVYQNSVKSALLYRIVVWYHVYLILSYSTINAHPRNRKRINNGTSKKSLEGNLTWKFPPCPMSIWRGHWGYWTYRSSASPGHLKKLN